MHFLNWNGDKQYTLIYCLLTFLLRRPILDLFYSFRLCHFLSAIGKEVPGIGHWQRTNYRYQNWIDVCLGRDNANILPINRIICSEKMWPGADSGPFEPSLPFHTIIADFLSQNYISIYSLYPWAFYCNVYYVHNFFLYAWFCFQICYIIHYMS